MKDIEKYLDLYLTENSNYSFASIKLKKQLNSVPKYKERILDYFGPKCEKFWSKVKNYIASDQWRQVVANQNVIGGNEISSINQLIELLLKVDVCLTDIYAICLLFRTYE